MVIIIAVGAAVLLAGRVLAMVYTDYVWYLAPAATSIWKERLRDLASIHIVSILLAGMFTLVNLSALRRSIISLAFPRRLGNVEFGEAVPQRYVDRFVFALSALVAATMSLAAPAWQSLALVRGEPKFGDADPFFQRPLEFYVAWIPLEAAMYTWALLLLVLVATLVIGLYSLTPSLRWHNGKFHVSVRVRRHLTVLASLLLLTMAWRYRLDGYGLLTQGSGVGEAFSYIDHQWLIPAYLSLSVGTVAGAVLVFATGWAGRVRASFFTVSAVLIVSVTLGLVLPSVVRSVGSASNNIGAEAPYQATREIFTRRAYGSRTTDAATPPREITRFVTFADSARRQTTLDGARKQALIYPGAVGAALITPGSNVQAPLLGTGLKRLAHAWSEQRFDLMWSEYPSSTKIVTTRDVRERLARLTPVFEQGSTVAPGYIADTLVWIVELYSASQSYPLSAHHTVAGLPVTYFRHAGTGLVNSRTARVTVVPAAAPDPISTAWRAAFPSVFRAGSRDILDIITATPSQPFTQRPSSAVGTPGDSAFRAEVTRLYEKMRAALLSGDLKAFGISYDSLGAAIQRE